MFTIVSMNSIANEISQLILLPPEQITNVNDKFSRLTESDPIRYPTGKLIPSSLVNRFSIKKTICECSIIRSQHIKKDYQS